MTDRFDVCLPRILTHEAGYVNHPRDPGGPTNLGVTQATLSHWLGHPASIADVQALTPAAVSPIYRANYWRAASCDQLPPGVDYVVFDAAVLSGIRRAVTTLQEAAGSAADGHFGTQTLAAVASVAATDLVRRFCTEREIFFRGLGTFATFGRGWINRLNEVRDQALRDAA